VLLIIKVIKGYKFVNPDLTSEHGNVQWVIGEWQKYEGKLTPESGFYATNEPIDSLVYEYYSSSSRWFECEARGEIHDLYVEKNTFYASEMRLIREIPKSILTQFAIDCPRVEKYRHIVGGDWDATKIQDNQNLLNLIDGI
jgi:hypothetical protein